MTKKQPTKIRMALGMGFGHFVSCFLRLGLGFGPHARSKLFARLRTSSKQQLPEQRGDYFQGSADYPKDNLNHALPSLLRNLTKVKEKPKAANAKGKHGIEPAQDRTVVPKRRQDKPINIQELAAENPPSDSGEK